MAVIMTLCKISNLCCKWEYMTLIFMFNPCHIVGVSNLKLLVLQMLSLQMALIIIGFSKFSVKVEMLALFVFSSAFGGWVGLIWAEIEEFSTLEHIVYYTEHLFTSFLGPVVLSLSGRFDPLKYTGWPLPVCGFHIFCVYMRYVLTPLSHLTWCNLNHNLCGVDNDPFYSNFNLGYTYYFWADLYLLWGCYVTIATNYVICLIFKGFFSCCLGESRVKDDDSKKAQ